MSRRRLLAAIGLGVGAATVGGIGISQAIDEPRSNSKKTLAAATTPIALGAQTYSYQDFTEPTSAMTCALIAGGIIGKGSDRTIIDLTGPIRTQFPTWHTGDTTRWNVIRIEPGRGQRLPKPVLSGFTLRVSAPQVPGALFNGIRVARCDDILIEDVRVEGVPGTGNLPPFETLGLDLLSCARPLLRGVVVDGQGRGGAGIGLNGCNDAYLDSCEAFRNANSHGFACYQSQRVTFVNCVSERNGTGVANRGGAGFSHEDCEEVLHMRSRARGNSLASFRFLATGRSSTGNRIIRSDADGTVLVQGNQVATGISVETSTTAGFTEG